MGMGSKKQEISIWQHICLYVADHIAVEDRKRSRFREGVVFLHYFTDYVILWVAIQQSYNPNYLMSFDWPFVIARAILAVAFIISRKPLIFLIAKLTLLIQSVTALPTLAFLEALVALVQVGMAGVWALTKQQRMLHFDSRFEIAGAFMKQLFFYAMMTAQILLPSGPTQYEGQFIFLGGLVVLTLTDFSEIYYNPLTKAMLLRIDYILLLLTVATIYQSVLGIGYFQFLFASLFLFVVAGLHLVLAGIKRASVLQINSQELGNLPEEALVDAMIELKRTADGGDSEAIETYLYKMRDQSEDAALLEKIAECREKDGASRQELLNSFIFQTLKRAAKSSKRLRDLVIYLYSPSPRLYCFLDLQDWQHLREYRRILAEELNDTTLREAEAQKELEEVKGLVLRYTRASNILLQQLMKERIHQGKVQRYGQELVRLLEQLTHISAADRTKSRQVRDLINRFALDCLPAKYQLSMLRREEGVQQQREQFAEVVMGGEEDNYCRLLEANSGFTKMAYLRKDRHLGRHLSTLLPTPFLAHLLRYLKQIARHQQAQQLAPAFLFNSLGFVVPVRWKVQATTHRSGRAWKLSLRQEVIEKAVMVVSGKGELQGFSQLARYFSLGMSEKGKRIQAEALGELKSNALHYLSMGEALFEDHQFYMAKGVIMTVLEEFTLDGQSFWLLELKESDMRLKSLANPLLKPPSDDPPAFEFHYDWARNRYTTEMVQLRGLAAGQVQEKRAAINYAENITEMRYFEEKIDYKSNKEEEAECPSLEPHLHRISSSLTLNQFYQKWDRKKNSLPLWFKGSVTLIVLLCVAGLFGAVYFLTAFNSASSAAGASLQVSTKLQEKLQSAVLLGQLTTLPLTSPSSNVSQAIASQITLTNSLSSQLYALDQNIFNANGGQTILDQLNTLNLYINSYLLTANYPYRNALTLITTKIVPSFNTFIVAVLNSYAANTATSGTRTVVLVFLAVGCFGLFMGIWAIDFRQALRRSEITEILKFIENDDLEGMRERTIRFKETWLDNVDSREPQQGEEGQRETMSPPKHLIPTFRLRRRKAFHFLWLGGLVTFLVVLNKQINDFVTLTSNYVAFENSLASQVTSLQTVWAELNAASPNVTLIQSLISGAMSNQYSKNVMLKTMAGARQVDDTFISQYGGFWQSQDCCRYFSDTNCSSIIGGAMTEGANMAICYLNIQHDNYLQNNMKNFSLYSQSSQPSVALLTLNYLPQITQTSNQFILAEWNSMQGVFSLNTQYLFIGLVLHSLLALILLGWAVKERKTTSRVQELLMIMPFEKLKTFSAFHKYYTKYYATY